MDQGEAADPRLNNLERQNTWMWVLAGSLLVALGLAVVVQHFTGIWGAPDSPFPAPRTGDTLMAALLGLLVLFSLYVVLKQRELRCVRTNLVRERLQRESLRSRLSELTALFEIAMQANSQPQLSLFLSTVTQRLLVALEAQGCCIFLNDPEDDELRCEVASGPGAPVARGTRAGLNSSLVGTVARNLETLLLDATELARRFPTEFSSTSHIGAVLCVPLRTGHDLMGVLLITREDAASEFTQLDASVVMALVDHLAMAIRRIDEFTELTRRTKHLEAANQRLDELNRVKRVSISTINHEIRTPLTAMLSNSDLWLQERMGLDEKTQVQLIEAIHDHATRLTEFVVEISDLLALELGSQTLNLTPVSVSDIVSDNVLDLGPRAHQKKVIIETNLDEDIPEISIDAEKLRRSLRYLISNGIRFARRGGRIEIVTRAERGKDGLRSVIIGVVDDGLGANPADLHSIIPSTSYAANKVGHRVEALGLGFYLVKEVVGLHGGRVWSERKDNRSGFWFSLPSDIMQMAPSLETGEQSQASWDQAA
jgi:K+-sensing histidine kinase KdpD